MDLQSEISLRTVRIYNREDCCKDRLSDTTVSLLNESDNVVGTFRIGNVSNKDMIEINISDFIPSSGSIDIGSVGYAGSSVTNNGQFVIKGSGKGRSLKTRISVLLK